MTARVPKLAAAALLCLAQLALPRVVLAQITLTSPLVVTPTSPLVGQPATATFTVKNSGTSTITVPYFVAAGRASSGANQDFPASQPVTLAAGQTYQYQSTKTFTAHDTITSWPSYYKGGSTWVNLDRASQFSVQSPAPAHLTVITPVTLSPLSLIAGSIVTASFTVKNDGGSPASIQYLLVGGRIAGTQNVDFPSAPAFVLQPGAMYQYRQQRPVNNPGDLTYWPAAYMNGTWTELTARSTSTVHPACWPVTSGSPTWPSAGACFYAPDSPFYKPLPADAPAVGNSRAIMDAYFERAINKYPDNLVTDTTVPNGEPTYFARTTDPQYKITCVIYDCPFLSGYSVFIPEGAEVEDPGFATTNDAHMTIVDLAQGLEFDFWQVRRPGGRVESSGGRVLDVSAAAMTRLNTRGYSQFGEATAAGFASLAGRLRAEELLAGRVPHALFINFACDDGQPPLYLDLASVPEHPNKNTDAGTRCKDLNLRPAATMGSRIRLAMTKEAVDGLTEIKPWQRIILHALREFGAYFGDTGTNGLFSIEVEANNQYTSMGAENKWVTFAQQAGWQTTDGRHYVGSLRVKSSNALDAAWWWTNVWRNLEIVQPCVTQGTCP